MTPQKKLNTCESKCNNITSWEQGNGAVVRALAFNQLRHGFKSRGECHMWVEFVVELLCYFALSGFCLATLVFASPQKLRVSSIESKVTNQHSLVPWFLDRLNVLEHINICRNILFQADLQTLKCIKCQNKWFLKFIPFILILEYCQSNTP